MLDHFLSDEFVNFSTSIASVHQQKKDLKEAYLKYRDEFNANLKTLNERAESLIGEFETWKQAVNEKQQQQQAAEKKKG